MVARSGGPTLDAHQADITFLDGAIAR